MNETDRSDAEYNPIATATRVPPDDADDPDGSLTAETTDEAPIATATRVPPNDAS